MNYISEAADALHVAGNATNDVPAARYTARAQALATLAMAEQQRIANLIAYAMLLEAQYAEAAKRPQGYDWSTREASIARHTLVLGQIREGLGLS